jgi:hypothetical protein
MSFDHVQADYLLLVPESAVGADDAKPSGIRKRTLTS